MDWTDLENTETTCGKERSLPGRQALDDYVASPYWVQLCDAIETTFGVAPLIEYSLCSMAPGFNLKYRKGSRALCTLYPDKGRFHCMVSIGRKQEDAFLAIQHTLDPVITEIYAQSKPFNGSRWLTIPVSTQALMEDVKTLVDLRMRFR